MSSTGIALPAQTLESFVCLAVPEHAPLGASSTCPWQAEDSGAVTEKEKPHPGLDSSTVLAGMNESATSGYDS